MSKARAKAMTGARMTEAAPQAVMQQADALLKRWMRGASLQTMEDSQHLGQNDAVRLVVALAEALTTTAQQARAAEREERPGTRSRITGGTLSRRWTGGDAAG